MNNYSEETKENENVTTSRLKPFLKPKLHFELQNTD